MNATNENSAIDSENENQPTGDASILNGKQLLRCVVLLINALSGRVKREGEEKLSNKNEKNRQLPKATKQGKINNHHLNNWLHSDMFSYNGFYWQLEATIVDKTNSPTTLFKKSFTGTHMY